MVADLTPKKTVRVGSIVIVDDGRDLVLEKSHSPHDRIVIEFADRWDALAALMATLGVAPFDKRCADRLADEVDVLVRRKVIDARSPAGDALLDYRNPPQSGRSDRILDLEEKVASFGRGQTLVQFAAAHVQSAMKQVRGNKTRAAKLLGIDRRTLYRWLDGGPSLGRPRKRGTRKATR